MHRLTTNGSIRLGAGGPSSTLVDDFLEALRLHRVWLRFGWMDLKLRNRRSFLGPWWLTLNSAIYMFTIGVLFSFIFGEGVRSRYLPYFGAGYLIWLFISHVANESTNVFRNAKKFILHRNLPQPVWVYEMMWKNILIILYILPIYLVVMVAYRMTPGVVIFTVLPAFALLVVNMTWIATLLGIACLRYRDLGGAVQSLVRVGYLFTPILWQVEMLGEHRLVVDLNPAYHMIETLRAPLLGEWPGALSWLVVAGMAVVGWAATLVIYRATRHRIPYWL